MREHTESILAQLHKRMAEQEPVILAIDGTSAALKSTLAAYLAQELDGAVVHCDDFFLPMELRSEKRYQEPGGNIHYERMQEEVIEKLARRGSRNSVADGVMGSSLEEGTENGGFHYIRYDCSKGALSEKRWVPDKPLIIVEGAYALHPYFGKYYDMSLFLTVDVQVQMKRIEKRNPNPQVFKDRWIPLEQKYFKAFSISGKVDLILDTTAWK